MSDEGTATRRALLTALGTAVAGAVLAPAGTAQAAGLVPAPRRPRGVLATTPKAKSPVRKKPVLKKPVARKPTKKPATKQPVLTKPVPKPAVSAPASRPVPTAPADGPSPLALPSQAPAAGTSLLTADPLLHLLRRTTWGLTGPLVEQAKALGAEAWLERQLAPTSIDDSVCEGSLSGYATLGMSIPEVRAAAPSNGSGFSMNEVSRAALVRACWSERQLLEVMVDFWSNHLNVTCPSGSVWDNRADYDRTVIRPHALGRFADMLQGAARSPAMLRYLNGADSRGSAPNENYGRELLELHTVGVAGGYAEADIRQSALVLTGLTVWNEWDKGVAPGQAGTFRYRTDWHAVGPLTVMGWSHPNADRDGQAVVTSYLDHLARHPSTARRLATKLCLRFVSDAPPPALVDRLAQAYLAADTAVVPVLRMLFASPEFAASVGAKTRRPMEDVVATVRVLGVRPLSADPGATDSLFWQTQALGQGPLGWHPPNGYPDVAAAWTSAASTLGRWNLHLGLVSNWWPTQIGKIDLKGLVGPAATVGQLLDRLAQLLHGQPLRPADRTVLLAFIGAPDTAPASSGKADSSALPVLAALLLDSPVWSLR